MAGLEILGAVAAAGQLLSSIAQLIQLSIELRDKLRKGPQIFQEKNEYLDSLIRVLECIRTQASLQTIEVSGFVEALRVKVEAIRARLLRYFINDTGKFLNRLLGSLRATRDRVNVLQSFEALDREKSNLLLYISAVSNESIYRLVLKAEMPSNSPAQDQRGPIPGYVTQPNQPSKDLGREPRPYASRIFTGSGDVTRSNLIPAKGQPSDGALRSYNKISAQTSPGGQSSGQERSAMTDRTVYGGNNVYGDNAKVSNGNEYDLKARVESLPVRPGEIVYKGGNRHHGHSEVINGDKVFYHPNT